MKPFKTYLRLYFAITAMLILSAPVYSQPNLQHSIYFKQKFCSDSFFYQANFYLEHSKGGRYGTYLALTPPPNGVLSQKFVKYDNNWDTLFSVTYKGNGDNRADKILELPNGNILIAGYTESDDNGVVYGFSLKLSFKNIIIQTHTNETHTKIMSTHN